MSDWKEVQAVIAELERQSETMASTGAFWRSRFVELTTDATQNPDPDTLTDAAGHIRTLAEFVRAHAKEQRFRGSSAVAQNLDAIADDMRATADLIAAGVTITTPTS